ncbi:MAG TPA: hypothetical protein EYP19_16190 [Desulfobacterales bacterium]|nr:hypothetical protein [Desulfobacterales bacterium]
MGLQNDWAHPFYGDPQLALVDEEDARHGRRSLCLPLARLYGRERTLMRYKPIPAEEGAIYTFSADMKASADNARVAGSRERLGKEWKRISFPVKPRNGVLTLSIDLSGADRFWIDAAMLVKGKEAKAFTPAREIELALYTKVPGNCFTEDEPVMRHVMAVSYLADVKIRPRVSITDYWQNEVWSKRITFELKAGVPVDVAIRARLRSFGHFRAVLRDHEACAVVAERVLTRMRAFPSPQHRAASPA